MAELVLGKWDLLGARGFSRLLCLVTFTLTSSTFVCLCRNEKVPSARARFSHDGHLQADI